MHRILILSLLILLPGIHVLAIKVTGKVTDDKGNALAYASILIKGTTRGVTAGNEGRYALDLAPGTYTLVCQYVGYTRREKTITIGSATGARSRSRRLSAFTPAAIHGRGSGATRG